MIQLVNPVVAEITRWDDNEALRLAFYDPEEYAQTGNYYEVHDHRLYLGTDIVTKVELLFPNGGSILRLTTQNIWMRYRVSLLYSEETNDGESIILHYAILDPLVLIFEAVYPTE